MKSNVIVNSAAAVTTKFLFGMCDCTVDFSLVPGIMHVCGRAHQSTRAVNAVRRHQNVKLQISAGTFHPNLHLTIYYILFFLQVHFSQICVRRHMEFIMRPGVWTRTCNNNNNNNNNEFL